MLTIAPTLAIGENASMSQKAMPFIFLNMTGEMAYILEQRLIAQKVTKARCRQVLSDILKIVFNEKFLTKLFDPQEQYSRSSLRQYFEKMAHSSVMRLNESSMNRLFDMLTMSVKQQIMLAAEPTQLIQITINHLNGILKLTYNEEVVTNVKYAHELLVKCYKDAQVWEMAIIRGVLLNFFQDLRIRVSQLMRLGLQMDDGRFELRKQPIEIPNGATQPGTIRYFDKGQMSRITTFVIADQYFMNENKGTFELMDPTNRNTDLGDNIFKEDQSIGQDGKPERKKKTATGAEEAKLLSKLINRPEPQEGGDNFVLSIFDDENDKNFDQNFRPETSATSSSMGTNKSDEKRPRSKGRTTTSGDSTKVKLTKPKSLAGAMQEMDIKSSTPAKKTRGEELLKMMDEQSDDRKAQPIKSTGQQRAPRSRSGSRKAIRNQSAVGPRKT